MSDENRTVDERAVAEAMRQRIEEATSSLHDAQLWFDDYYCRADQRGKTVGDRLIDDLIVIARRERDAPPPTLTAAERRELEVAASEYESGAEKIVYGRQGYRQRAATLRGLLARAAEGATNGPTLTDAERVLLELLSSLLTDGDRSTLRGLLARAAKEETR
jgi:hypothetical protein